MKKYNAPYVALLVTMVTIMVLPSYGQAVSEFGKKEVKVSDWVDRHFKKGQLPPFSFVYNNEHSSKFIKKWKFSSQKGSLNKRVRYTTSTGGAMENGAERGAT